MAFDLNYLLCHLLPKIALKIGDLPLVPKCVSRWLACPDYSSNDSLLFAHKDVVWREDKLGSRSLSEALRVGKEPRVCYA